MRAMKDSGVEWIGEIPLDWEVVPNKRVMSKVKEICEEYSGENILSLTMNGVIVRDLENPSGKMPLTFDGYQRVKKGNLLMCLFDIDVTPRCIGEIMDDGITSPAYSQFRLLNDNCARYYYYYYLNLDYSKELLHLAKNLRHSLTESQLGEVYVPLPKIYEQQRIADYLDSKCSKIDSIIEKQQVVIEKLKEYKLSVITETVTKGLNPDVAMKDSGVEWIGEVPKTTTVTRAGHIFDIILGKMLANIPSSETDTMEKYFCAANVHFTGIDYENLKVMWFSEKEKQTYKVNVGDLLVVEGGAGAGGAFVVDRDIEDIYVQNSILIVRSNGNVSAKWLQYSLFALVNRGYIDFVCNKATIPHFTKEKLSDVPVVIFSSVDEKFILNFLDDKCEQINNSIANREQLIDKLREYKKSLIYEVVTGKKEV